MEEWSLGMRQGCSASDVRVWDDQFTGKRWKKSFVCQLEKHTRNLSCSGTPEMRLSSVETVQIYAQTLWHWSGLFFQMSLSLQKSKGFLIIYLSYTCMWPVSKKKKNHTKCIDKCESLVVQSSSFAKLSAFIFHLTLSPSPHFDFRVYLQRTAM